LATDNGGSTVFHPDAFPIVTTAYAFPAAGTQVSAHHGSSQPVSGTMVYGPPTQPPFAGPVRGVPYTVYYSYTSDSGPWTAGTGSVTSGTGAFSGNVALSPTPGATTWVEVETPTYNDMTDSYATQFAPYLDFRIS